MHTMQRKPIFDVIRTMLGRGFTDAEVGRIDAAIDQALDMAQVLSASNTPACPVRLGDTGAALIRQFEGCARKLPDGMFEAYPDPGTGGEPWTIGWGVTMISGRKVRPGDVISQAEADTLLEDHLGSYAAEVARALGGAPTSQEQFDALVSFHYNTGAISSATLTKKHCAGDFSGAAAEFERWNRAAGKVMKGLVRRRQAEAELYRRGC